MVVTRLGLKWFVALVTLALCAGGSQSAYWLEDESEVVTSVWSWDQTVERFLANNLDLQISGIEIEKARADEVTAGLRPNPTLQANITLIPYGRFSNQRPGGPTQYEISLMTPIDVAGKRSARMVAASQVQRVKEALHRENLRQGTRVLAQAWLEVLAANENLKLMMDALESLRQLEQAMQKLVQQGETARSELARVQTRQALAALDVSEAKLSLANAKQKLGSLSGLDASASEQIEVREPLRPDALIKLELPPEAEIVTLALESRPDYQAAQLATALADAEIRLAHANRLPDPEFTIWPYIYQDNSPFGSKSATSWSAGLSLPLPVWHRNPGPVIQAQTASAQRRLELQALELKIRSEVIQARQQLETTKAKVLDFESNVLPREEQILKDTQELFRKGEQSLITVLRSQQNFQKIAKQYHQALTQLRQASEELNTTINHRTVQNKEEMH